MSGRAQSPLTRTFGLGSTPWKYGCDLADTEESKKTFQKGLYPQPRFANLYMALGTARKTGLPESQNPSSHQDHNQFAWKSALHLWGDS